MEDRVEAALVGMRRILRATEMSGKQLASQCGLTVSQMLVLMEVKRTGASTAGEIAVAVRLSQATVTTLVDRLETLGYVRRRKAEPDRRRVWVEITEAGRRAAEAAPDLLQDRFRKRFLKLPDWEQAFLVAALERIGTLINAQEIDASPVLDVGAVDRPGSDKLPE